MYYFVILPLNKVIAMSMKCGCSSVKTQILLDLGFTEVKYWESHNLITKEFPISPKLNDFIFSEYVFEWYVRDPFSRILSCFLHKKSEQKEGIDCTFKQFIFNLENEGKNIEMLRHIEPQIKGYFSAPWNVYNIERHERKLNSSNYSRGFVKNAWDIPLKNLFDDKTVAPIFSDVRIKADGLGATYTKESFFSIEIFNKVKEIYWEDYKILLDYNIKFYKHPSITGPKHL